MCQISFLTLIVSVSIITMQIQKLINDQIPEQLQIIHSAPKQLFLLGEPIKPDEKCITIVGARKSTNYGREVTEMLAGNLARAGAVIVSGLALGIDSIAHKACLDAGGRTIAVMPCGLDEIYPATHRNLAKEILARGGTLLSEYDVGTPALKQHFIARNRLVSGLSEAVIVIEAAQRSGTLITASFALDQNRDVYALPGNITSPNSVGTNSLIESGAQIITSSERLIEQLGLTSAPKRSLSGESDQENTILELLENGIRDGYELQLKSEIEVTEFNQTMTMMEITGKIRALGANQWTIS